MATIITNKYYEGSDFQILSQVETTRGQNPDTGGTTGTWLQMPLSSFTPGYAKTRNRPTTIRQDKQSSKGVTTQIACNPQAVVPFVSSTFNSWIQAALNNDQFTAGSCSNSNIFQSHYIIQQGPGTDDNFAYPGCWPSGLTLNHALNGFAELTFPFFAEDRISITDAEIVDAITLAPEQSPYDPVTLASGISFGGSDLIGVNSMTLTLAKDGAESIYEYGQPNSTSIAMGAINVTFNAQLYFKDLSYFNDVKAETEGELIIKLRETDGLTGYDITMPAATTVNFSDPVNGPGIILTTLDFEANASPHTINFTGTS